MSDSQDTRDVVIRDMDAADGEAVIDLIQALNRYEDAISGDRITTRRGAADCLAANRRKVREGGGAHLVAEAGGRVVAYACCGVVDGEAYLRPDLRRYGYIFEVVVAEGWRGRGVGEALIRACEDVFRGLGLSSAGIGVLAGNKGAGRLYDRLGYRPHAVERLKQLD